MILKSLRLLLPTALLLGAAAAPAQDTVTNAPATNALAIRKGKATTPMLPLSGRTGAAVADKPKLLADGAAAADFISNDAAGKAVHLTDFHDKVVVLDFWATWCGPCQKSLPHTQSVAHEYKAQGVVVLAVCTSDTRANFDGWVKDNQAKYPDIIFTSDPNERGSATFSDRVSSKLFGVAGIPTQFVIGSDAKVRGSLVGYSDGDTRLETVLKGAVDAK